MTLEQQLQQLREEWKSNIGTSRTILEQRARLIKWAIEKRDAKLQKTVENVKEAIF